MNKAAFKIIIILRVGFIAASAIAELLFPSKLLEFVAITSNPQLDFVLRTTAVALIAYLPGLWTARNLPGTPGFPSALFGSAIYMFLSSAVDFQAFSQGIVNRMSVPSVALRMFLGPTILWPVMRSTTK